MSEDTGSVDAVDVGARAMLAPPGSTVTSPAATSVCRRERIIGLLLYATGTFILLSFAAFVPKPEFGEGGWIFLPVSDTLAAGLAAAVYLLVIAQTQAMAPLGTGERPWRSSIGSGPRFGKHFSLFLLAWVALPLIYSCLPWIFGGGHRSIAFVGAIATAAIVFLGSSAQSRITLGGAGPFRAGWAGLLAAAVLAPPLMVAGPLVAASALGVTYQPRELPVVIYIASVCALFAACVVALALAPAVLRADGRPSESFPASIYSGALARKVVGGVFFRANIRRARVAGAILAAAAIAAPVGLVWWASGGWLLVVQTGFASLTLGSLAAASTWRGIILWKVPAKIAG
jgi:hypothetical protein